MSNSTGLALHLRVIIAITSFELLLLRPVDQEHREEFFDQYQTPIENDSQSLLFTGPGQVLNQKKKTRKKNTPSSRERRHPQLGWDGETVVVHVEAGNIVMLPMWTYYRFQYLSRSEQYPKFLTFIVGKRNRQIDRQCKNTPCIEQLVNPAMVDCGEE